MPEKEWHCVKVDKICYWQHLFWFRLVPVFYFVKLTMLEFMETWFVIKNSNDASQYTYILRAVFLLEENLTYAKLTVSGSRIKKILKYYAKLLITPALF